ncbi:hypothetical protein GN956_G4990 [Arapaima gigas]
MLCMRGFVSTALSEDIGELRVQSVHRSPSIQVLLWVLAGACFLCSVLQCRCFAWDTSVPVGADNISDTPY